MTKVFTELNEEQQRREFKLGVAVIRARKVLEANENLRKALRVAEIHSPATLDTTMAMNRLINFLGERLEANHK